MRAIQNGKMFTLFLDTNFKLIWLTKPNTMTIYSNVNVIISLNVLKCLQSLGQIVIIK